MPIISIANLRINIQTLKDIYITDAFRDFLVTDHSADWSVEIKETASFKSEETVIKELLPVHSEDEFIVYSDGKKCFFDKRLPVEGRAAYAISVNNQKERLVKITYRKESSEFFSDLQNVFFHIGFEEMLLSESKFIVHASCIDTEFGGVLFSGVSGIGKSTQAKLWCRYRAAELLNGDRPVVGKEDGIWKAYGSPYAGSSRCYKNKSVSVSAVVLLSQASENSIRRVRPAEAFRRIYSNCIVLSWDKKFVETLTSLVFCLIKEIPVFELSCRPDEGAVALLEKTLRRNN